MRFQFINQIFNQIQFEIWKNVERRLEIFTEQKCVQTNLTNINIPENVLYIDVENESNINLNKIEVDDKNDYFFEKVIKIFFC